MGHSTDKDFLKNYSSRLINADIRGIILHGKQAPALSIDKLIRIEMGAKPPADLPDQVKKCVDLQLGIFSQDLSYTGLKKGRFFTTKPLNF